MSRHTPGTQILHIWKAGYSLSTLKWLLDLDLNVSLTLPTLRPPHVLTQPPRPQPARVTEVQVGALCGVNPHREAASPYQVTQHGAKDPQQQTHGCGGE
ncbi:hypothetical protein E2C01_063883 [Portunus trituberculatus]|uniref:Uncharacterized protein n=1 Tax=Portunus trituberculatus TaxID=210409 RepID=A0A5B7HHL8_PORTR|nr:hypothetical protein [Portunus trituberculatus]